MARRTRPISRKTELVFAIRFDGEDTRTSDVCVILTEREGELSMLDRRTGRRSNPVDKLLVDTTRTRKTKGGSSTQALMSRVNDALMEEWDYQTERLGGFAPPIVTKVLERRAGDTHCYPLNGPQRVKIDRLYTCSEELTNDVRSAILQWVTIGNAYPNRT